MPIFSSPVSHFHFFVPGFTSSHSTRDLGSSNCPIRFENAFAISRDRNGAVRSHTALEEPATSQVYKLRPKNRQKLCWLLSANMTCLFHLLKVRVELKIRISMNLVVSAVIIAVASVIVHAGSGKSRCFSLSYLLSTSSLSYLVKVLPKVKFIIKQC